MTCIVGLVDKDGTVWMGGDRATFDQGGQVRIIAAPKVLRVGGMLIGCTGVRAGHDVLELMARNPPDCSGDPEIAIRERVVPLLAELCDRHFAVEQDPKGKVYPRYLVGLGGRLFLIDNGMGITERQGGYDAIGQGMDVGLGVLWACGALDDPESSPLLPEQQLRFALEGASELLDGVRGPFDILSLPKVL